MNNTFAYGLILTLLILTLAIFASVTVALNGSSGGSLSVEWNLNDVVIGNRPAVDFIDSGLVDISAVHDTSGRIVRYTFDLRQFDAPADEECATYEGGSIEWQTCAGGTGDNISVNGSAATDANFLDGDIDWTLNTVPVIDEITATVACLDCVTLATETTGNYIATVTGPAAGITVSGSGSENAAVSLALANDLSAIEGLAGTGLAVRTAADTWTTRTITGTNGIEVTNGDGIAANPSVAINDLDSPADEECSTWETGSSQIEWQPCDSGLTDFGRFSLSGTHDYALPGGNSVAVTTTNRTANVIFYEPWYIFENITIDQLAVEVTTAVASTTCRLGIYLMDTNWNPTTLIIDAGTIDAASTGIKTITLGSPLTLTQSNGRYMSATVCNNTVTFRTLRSSPINAGHIVLGSSPFHENFRNNAGSGEHTALSNPALGVAQTAIGSQGILHGIVVRISTP